MDPRDLTMYQHPRMSLMGQSSAGSVPGSIPIHYQMNNSAQGNVVMQGEDMSDSHVNYTHKAEQQHYNQHPGRQAVHDDEINGAVIPNTTTAHHSPEENVEDHPATKEEQEDVPSHYLNPELDDDYEPPEDPDSDYLPTEEIKTEVDDDASHFLEINHDIFVRISHDELKIKEAADILERPYSYVYSRYQEFCGNVAPKPKAKPKKKKAKRRKGQNDRKRKRNRGRLTLIKGSSVTPGQTHQCQECPAVFNREHSLKTHSRVHSGESESHLCTACGICFARVVTLMSHRIKVHEDALQCPHCDKQYTVVANYKFHVKSHAKVRPFICEQCNKGFWSKMKLEDHYRRHTGERPFMCGFCEKTFITIGNLKYHQNIHSDEPKLPKAYNYACDQCPSRFTNNANLTRHKAIHTGIKPYTCNFCPAAFVLKTDLARHEMAHTGNKPFKCTYCDYSTVRKPILEYHMNTHTGNKPYKCDFYGCSAEYARPSTLDKHKEKHGPPPVKTCKVCNEQFPNINALKSHMMIHPGNRPVPCDQCDKIFYNESTLKRHMHVHMYKADGTKPKQIVRHRSKQPRVPKPPKQPEYKAPSILPSEYQKNLGLNLSTDYKPEYQVPVTIPAANGHNSRVHQWTVNAEDTSSQQSFHHAAQVAHAAFPSNVASQFTNLNAWPSTMDPDELRRRLINSFN